MAEEVWTPEEVEEALREMGVNYRMSERAWDLNRPDDIPAEVWEKTTAGQAGKLAAAGHQLLHALIAALPVGPRQMAGRAHERKHARER